MAGLKQKGAFDEMVTRRQIVKALAASSTILASNLVAALSPAEAAEEEGARVKAQSPSTGIRVTKLLEQPLPEMEGKVATVVIVEFPPGVDDKAHRHPGSVFAYVLEGSITTQVEPGPIVTYMKGQMWYEPPMHVHRIVRSASKTRPAKLLALLISDKGQPVLIPES